MRIAGVLVVGVALALPAMSATDPLSDSFQVLVVKTANWKATTGTLQRYERDSIRSEWRKVGRPIPVVLGRNGLAPEGEKREGDGRSPAGVYSIGTAFGMGPTPGYWLPYHPIRNTTECVDDSASRFYNQIVDRDRVEKVDWSSSEKMRFVPEYLAGAVVNYNTPAQPGKGSCIFLHVWAGPNSTTAGCTAMPSEEIFRVLRWLDPLKEPKLVQFPEGKFLLPRGAREKVPRSGG